MIDPSIIDEMIDAARARDNIVTAKLLGEIARLAPMSWATMDQAAHGFHGPLRIDELQRGNKTDSGIPQNQVRSLPENGSFAYQLYSAICFTVDARAELKLLELIASPNFYAALMRSAAEVKP